MEQLQLVECPRDAMQGLGYMVPTEQKIAYLQQLLACGFHTLDCGSFVSPKAVPQMADSGEVLDAISVSKGNTRLLTIVANERGARQAAGYAAVDDLGFPFSINETFQQRNANSTILEAFERLKQIHEIALGHNKSTVAYISMAFGNPYGDQYDRDTVLYWVEKIADLGIQTISLADTVGSAKTEDVAYCFSKVSNHWPNLNIGAHFHARPGEWSNKIAAAWDAGCRRFDGALLGFGGCPFANDALTGNLPTEGLITWLQGKTETGVRFAELQKAMHLAHEIFRTGEH